MKKIALFVLPMVLAVACGSETAPPQTKVISQRIVVSSTAPSPSMPSPQAAAAVPKRADSVKMPSVPPAVQPAPLVAKADPLTEKTGSPPTAASIAPAKGKEAAALAEQLPPQAAIGIPQAAEPAAEAKDRSGADGIQKSSSNGDAGRPNEIALASQETLKHPSPDTAGGYSPAGKIDPFLPLFEEKPTVPDAADAEKQKKKRRLPLTPLERVDLSQLKLVGIIQASTGNKALVEEASGKGYIIKHGTFIGIHAGRVLEIQKDRVVVEEEVENVLGQFETEKKELKLQKPPGEF